MSFFQKIIFLAFGKAVFDWIQKQFDTVHGIEAYVHHDVFHIFFWTKSLQLVKISVFVVKRDCVNLVVKGQVAIQCFFNWAPRLGMCNKIQLFFDTHRFVVFFSDAVLGRLCKILDAINRTFLNASEKFFQVT